VLGEVGHALAFGQILPDQAVGVLVGWGGGTYGTPEAGLEPATRWTIEEAQENKSEHESASTHPSTEHIENNGGGQKT